jgi:large subunit ribosomal protein L27
VLLYRPSLAQRHETEGLQLKDKLVSERLLTGKDSMAHKKGQGSSRNGRDSNPQMLGIKLFAGQVAKPGSIICRQRGTHWRPGKNVRVGRDWTIYSVIDGKVLFDQEGRRINVVPAVQSAPGVTAPGAN